jgi:alcohol dehydrogenase class IV
VLLEHVVAYHFHAAEERFRRIAEAMNIDTCSMNQANIQQRLMSRIVQLKRSVSVIAIRGCLRKHSTAFSG